MHPDMKNLRGLSAFSSEVEHGQPNPGAANWSLILGKAQCMLGGHCEGHCTFQRAAKHGC